MTNSGAPVSHIPVLYKEILEALQPASGGRYVDGTLGAGGHALGILNACRPDGLLLGMDLDPQALAIARENLQEFADRVILVHASYAAMSEQLAMISWSEVQGILLDLGVSSMQLDTPVRGFSFQTEAPLDMRFDPANPVTAADLVNGLGEADLAKIIYRYGDEQSSRRIARAIVQSRPLGTTQELAAVVLRAVGGDRPHGRDRQQGKGRPGAAEKTAKKIHPATRTFQALRIAVNQELDAVEATLPEAIKALAPGGRLAVISFHSLEDRIVKQFFRQESRDCLCPPRQPVCTCGHRATVREITRRPIQPQASEVETNPRSRSARLRVAEKLSL